MHTYEAYNRNKTRLNYLLSVVVGGSVPCVSVDSSRGTFALPRAPETCRSNAWRSRRVRTNLSSARWHRSCARQSRSEGQTRRTCRHQRRATRLTFFLRAAGSDLPSSLGAMRNFRIRSACSWLRPVEVRPRMFDIARNWSFFNLSRCRTKIDGTKFDRKVVRTWLNRSDACGTRHWIGRRRSR